MSFAQSPVNISQQALAIYVAFPSPKIVTIFVAAIVSDKSNSLHFIFHFVSGVEKIALKIPSKRSVSRHPLTLLARKNTSGPQIRNKVWVYLLFATLTSAVMQLINTSGCGANYLILGNVGAFNCLMPKYQKKWTVIEIAFPIQFRTDSLVGSMSWWKDVFVRVI